VVRITGHAPGGSTIVSTTPGVFAIRSAAPVGSDGPRIPAVTLLRGGFPNPSPGSADVRFDVAAPGGPVAIAIYDVRGRLVRVLRDGWADPGTQSVAWDGRTATGMRAEPGIYFCLMTSGPKTLGRSRLVVVR
jgi:hypothetical protein